jgi:SNF2 family DNA or RNA helicase
MKSFYRVLGAGWIEMRKYKKAPPRDKRSLFSKGRDSVSSLFHFKYATEYDLVFNLVAPLHNGEDWVLEYYMRSVHDPSLMYPVHVVLGSARGFSEDESLWSLSLQTMRKVSLALKHSGYAPPSWDNTHPRTLSSEEAYEFITEDAQLLRDAGFIVQVPHIDYSKGAPRILLKVAGKMGPASLGALDSKSILSFDYMVALGDTQISRKDFLAYAKSKTHLVRVNDRWVTVDPVLAGRVASLVSSSRGKKSVEDVVSFTIRAAQAGIETDFESSGKVFDSVLDALGEGRYRPAHASSGFSGVLRPYQERGVAWLDYMLELGFGALLADDMGLGKTVQVISYVLSLLEKGERQVLIVCPTSVIGNWAEEFGRFAPCLRVKIHHGNERSGGKNFVSEAASYDVVVTSYAVTWRDEQDISSVNWSLVVADEAQNIKNPFTKQSAMLRKIPAKRRIALTGTPIENRLADIWSIMEYLNPGYLPSWEGFKEAYAKPIEGEKDAQKREAFRKALRPFILRRMKTDKNIICDLPEKTEKNEWCYLSTEQAAIYKAIVDKSLGVIDAQEPGKRKIAIIAALTKLKQVCNHPSNYLKDGFARKEDWEARSGKVERLTELVEVILENNESCLVFTQYAQMALLLKEYLSARFQAPVRLIYGSLKRKEREEILADYRKAVSPGILVLSLRAGGTGLNLIKANNVIHFDRWWNPAVENQATDRAYRIGQKKNVFVYKMITRGTVEEKIEKMLMEKKALADSIIEPGESMLSELSTEKLREFFSYREE